MIMNKYAQAAIEAAKLCSQENQISPRISWDQVTSRIFGKGTSSQKKGGSLGISVVAPSGGG